jgi:hypothetical protein
MLDCIVPVMIVVATTSTVDWHRRRLLYKGSGSVFGFGLRWTEEGINLDESEGYIQQMSTEV